MSKKTTRGPTKGVNKKVELQQKWRISVDELRLLQQRRMGLVGSLLGAFLVAVIGMCGYLQGCEGELFRSEAERNYLRSLRLDTQRGDIYDRNGEALATSVEVDTIYANPHRIEDPSTTARVLSDVLNIDKQTLLRRLTSDRHFVYVKRQVTEDESRAIHKLNLTGIMTLREAKRFYPKKELAGQILGIVGVDSYGREGLEVTYDQMLKGGKLEARYHRDAAGRYALLEGLPPFESRAGHSLVLTIDEKIQAFAERELERAVISSLARGGIAIVMDVATSDLLAVAHYPRFNPNRYREQLALDRAVIKNRALTDQFEPGSTFKIFTLAAGLEDGVIGLEDVISTHDGRFRVGKWTIHDTHRYKRLKCSDILKHSSNIGMAKIAMMVTKERLHEYLSAFGFGKPTGVGIVGDAPGLLRPAAQWADVTVANVAFGQGVAVTALQLTNALAAIGRGGLLMRPRIVKEVLDSSGNTVRSFPVKPVGRVVSVDTARQVIRAMEGVVEHDGTGHQAWMYEYRVAGKTGTAQKPDTIVGGYAEDRWIASFFGLVPAERPRLAILVLVDEPPRAYYGGVVAAPAFKTIAEWTLHYLQVPPSFGKRERLARKTKRKRLKPAPVAAEGAYYDYPEGSHPNPDPLEPLSAVVPSFSGLNQRQAAQLAHRHHLLIDIDGVGLVHKQAVPAGTPLDPWSRVTIYFRSPGEVTP